MTRTSLAWLGLVLGLVGCGSSTMSSFGSGADSSAAPAPAGAARNAGDGAGGATSGSGSSDGTAPAPAAPGTSSQGSGSQQSGQLTAGVWDDNLNFDFFSQYLAGTQSLAGVPQYSAAERQAARDKWLAPRTAKQELDVAFLFDTTGSMGDELSYVQTEIDAIAQSIQTKFPGTVPRFGLVLYRDFGDDYVTRSFDFTTDLAAFRANLAAQSAGGGGDYPEAVPEGLEQAVALSWRGGDVARLTFWVADAPGHETTAASTRAAIDGAIQKGVHVYPVAASGVDDRAELTMRTAAQATGGRYIFLTDDSGLGNSHAEPHIPCYVVTRFDHALVRMVESELTGGHVFAPSTDVIRTVGEPVDGKCETTSQGQVVLY